MPGANERSLSHPLTAWLGLAESVLSIVGASLSEYIGAQASRAPDINTRHGALR